MSEAARKCRLCLRKIDGKTGSTITDPAFRIMMSSVFYFWVPNGYAMPKSVCLQCYSTVSDFYGYSKTVEANLQLLKQDPLKLDCEYENKKQNDVELVEVKMEQIPDDGDQEEEDDDMLTDTTSDNGKESEASAAAGSSRTKTKGRPHSEDGSHPTADHEKAMSDDSLNNAGPSPSTRTRKMTSNADRRRVIEAYENGVDTETICNMFHLNRSTAYGIINKFTKTGVTESGKRGGRTHRKLHDAHVERIRALIDKDCSITLKKLQQNIREDFGVNLSHTTIAKVTSGFNYSFKSIYLIPECRNTQEDNIELRYEYADKFSKLSMAQMGDGDAVFVDEVAFTLCMRCSRGSRQGSRAAKEVSHLKKRYISIACAMNRNGIVHLSTKTKAFNQTLFLEFIEELKEKLSSQNVRHAVMIMDNVRFHKSEAIQNAVAVGGHELLFLPPYSPFLNPIENLFSQWKQITKRANPQNEAELINAIKKAASYITSADCDGYMSNMWTYITKCLARKPIEE